MQPLNEGDQVSEYTLMSLLECDISTQLFEPSMYKGPDLIGTTTVSSCQVP